MYQLKESPYKEELDEMDDEEKENKLEEWSKENEQAAVPTQSTTRSLDF